MKRGRFRRSLAFDLARKALRRACEDARRGTLAGFDAVAGGDGLDPAHAALVFPVDRDGNPTDEAARQFAAIFRAMDPATALGGGV